MSILSAPDWSALIPSAYSLGMVVFFIVGAAVGIWSGYRVGQARPDPATRKLIDDTLTLLQTKVASLEHAVSVTAEAERLLRQYNKENGLD